MLANLCENAYSNGSETHTHTNTHTHTDISIVLYLQHEQFNVLFTKVFKISNICVDASECVCCYESVAEHAKKATKATKDTKATNAIKATKATKAAKAAVSNCCALRAAACWSVLRTLTEADCC